MPSFKYEYVTRADRLPAIAEEIASATVLSEDLETTGFSALSCEIRLWSINTGKNSYVIDVFKTGRPDCVIQAHKDNTRAVTVGQNLKFDESFLLHHYGLELPNPFDTFRASNLIYNGLPNVGHNLWDLFRRELNVNPETQDLGGSDWGANVLTTDQLDYAAEDVYRLPQLREALRKKLVANSLMKVALIEFRSILGEAAVELNGFFLDKDAWDDIYKENVTNRDILQKKLWEMLPSPNSQMMLPGLRDEWNLDSTQQMVAALRKLGVKQTLKDETTRKTRVVPIQDTSEITLIMAADAYPILKEVIEYRGHSTQIKMFGPEYLEFINAVSGRIHPSYYPFATSGRFKIAKPNLGQIPRDTRYRKAFRAEHGNKLILADFSAIELRIIAEVSGDPTMLAVFNEPHPGFDDPKKVKAWRDLHLTTASIMSKKDKHLVTKAERSSAKPVNFGFCLEAGTSICVRRRDGKVLARSIERVCVGDEVMTHRRRFQKVYATQVVTADQQVVITMSGFGERLVCTPDHHWHAAANGVDYGWVAAKDITAGMFIDGVSAGVKVASVVSEPVESKTFYDFSVEEDESFFANNFVSHNCYGMQAEKLVLYAKQSYGVDLTLQQSRLFRDRYFETYEGVRRWHERALRDGEKSRKAFSINGRVRHLTEDSHNEYFNHPIQGCLQPQTRVLTSKGYKAIGDLHRDGTSGLKVWTGSSWAAFTAVNKGPCQFASLRLSNGSVLECDTRHEVLVVTPTGYEWRKYADLKSGDSIAVPLATEHEFDAADTLVAVKAQLGSKIHPSIPTDRIEDLWYWIGFFYGDGWKSSETGAVCFVIGPTQQNFVSRCVEFLRTIGLNPRVTDKLNEATGRTHFVVEAYSVELTRWMVEIGIEDATAHTKRLPSRVFGESIQNRKAFARGFMDADGNFPDPTDSGPNLHLCQREVLQDMQLLLRTLGVESKIRGPYKYKDTVSYRLDMSARLYRASLGENQDPMEVPRLVGLDTPKFLVDEFRAKFEDEENVYQRSPSNSLYVLFRRLLAGGTTNVYALRHLLNVYDLEMDSPIYAFYTLVSKTESKVVSDTYTLSVHDDLHRFDSEGIISKNTGADGLKASLRQVYENLKKTLGRPPVTIKGMPPPRVKMVHHVHDEIILESNDDKDLLPQAQADLERGMVDAMQALMTKVPIDATAAIGDSWADKE